MFKVINKDTKSISIDDVQSLLLTLNKFNTLTHFSPVLRFMQKPTILFPAQIR